jgi:hypothetical protein
MTRTGWVQPLLLAAVLAVGFGFVWGLVGLWATEVGVYVVGNVPAPEALVFLPDGTPRVGVVAGPQGEREYRDLAGNPAPVPDDETGWLAPALLPAGQPGGAADGGHIRSFADGQVPATYWYFMADGRPGGTAYFVGYDSKTSACVGYLGAAGFREGPPLAEELFPFDGVAAGRHARVFSTQNQNNPAGHPKYVTHGQAPRGGVSVWDVYVLGRGGRLFHADLRRRAVEVVLDEPRLRSVALVSGLPDPVRGTPARPAARTDDAVLVLDPHGKVLSRYPIPAGLRDRDLSFAETTAGEAVEIWSSPDDELAARADHSIYWVRPEGGTRQADVSLPASAGLRPLRVVGGVIVPSPLGLACLVGIVLPRGLLDEGSAPTYGQALRCSVAVAWPALVLAQVLSAGLAALCYRRQVRYAARGMDRLLWPLFVLVLGLPGWVGYRFGRSWPVLEACPACDRDVPRDRDACAHCTTQFPRPALKGTEVFA